ncbi:MAG: peptidylprolyl isomerase [Candidatus Omnitrophica bacterium]|nr:peptidylprolyl isomerase [Candidatus Omnitrophota bacterium]
MRWLFRFLGVCAWLGMMSAGVSAAAGTLAQFRTPLGDMTVELYDQDKPVTVKNFISCVQSGLYQNTFFHRCEPGFVIQGGGFLVANRTATGLANSYYQVPTFGKITNEFNVGRRLSNTFGTIAMAKVAGDPNSATSQWFFNLADNSAALDPQNGGFTVFGRVVEGTNVLNNFNQLAPGGGLVDMRYWYGNSLAVFYSLPVNYSGYTPPFYPDLMYVDISLLEVQVRRQSSGAREISWNSVSNRLNQVEFTTVLPPAWQSLSNVTGTGERLTVIDSSPESTNRFYRVRVDY